MRLSERVGGLDRFNMLWTFMAASTPYIAFSGAMEFLPGLLLLVRRSETAGALLSIGAVKLLSSHLLVLALFLPDLLPDSRSLFSN